MKKIYPFISTFLLLACSSNSGSDSISSRAHPASGALPMDCGLCHSVPLGARRAVTGTSGDFAGNASIVSHHVSGISDPDGPQCLACHNIDRHGSGAVRLKNADTGTVITAASNTDIETFCLSCHDPNGANGNMSPFSDGSVIGSGLFEASSGISSSWGKTYGHRRRGLTCRGTGAQDTGCHANGHGSSHAGLLSRNMTLPLTPANVYRENDFQLCFDCHGSYPSVSKEVVFGVNYSGAYYGKYGPLGAYPPYDIPEIRTRFRDQNHGGGALPYDDDNVWKYFYLMNVPVSVNLHWSHIAWDFFWQYRGNISSGTSCTACHNVHGTDTPWGMVHDEMGYMHYDGTGVDKYAQMNGVDPYVLDRYPTYCAYGCHLPTPPGFGKASAWFEPPNE
ncbi:MAG TPA: hypothetical protein VN604_09390 [Nitrospirota bacterium]|nr:hypothetical protein [Nitrospirota bacterium]